MAIPANAGQRVSCSTRPHPGSTATIAVTRRRLLTAWPRQRHAQYIQSEAASPQAITRITAHRAGARLARCRPDEGQRHRAPTRCSAHGQLQRRRRDYGCVFCRPEGAFVFMPVASASVSRVRVRRRTRRQRRWQDRRSGGRDWPAATQQLRLRCAVPAAGRARSMGLTHWTVQATHQSQCRH